MKHAVAIVILLLLNSCADAGDKSRADSASASDSTVVTDSTVAHGVHDSVLPAPDTANRIAPVIVAEDPKYPASFRILSTRAYCGGARPNDEILEERNTPKLLTSSTLKFKNHFTGKEYFITTDASGVAAARMEEGKYDVFLTKDINPDLPVDFDPNCNVWLNQVLLTVKVTASGKMQDVTIRFVCNPCDGTKKM